VRVRARARTFSIYTRRARRADRTTRPRWRMQFKSDGQQTARAGQRSTACFFWRVRIRNTETRKDRYAALFYITRDETTIRGDRSEKREFRGENFIRARDWKELSPSSSSPSSSAGVRNRRYVKLSLYLADVEEGYPPFPERFIEFSVNEHRERSSEKAGSGSGATRHVRMRL